MMKQRNIKQDLILFFTRTKEKDVRLLFFMMSSEIIKDIRRAEEEEK